MSLTIMVPGSGPVRLPQFLAMRAVVGREVERATTFVRAPARRAEMGTVPTAVPSDFHNSMDSVQGG